MLELVSYWFNATFGGKTYFQVVYIILFDFWLWVPLLYLFIKNILLEVWLMSRQIKFAKKQKFIVLAIDVPKKNEQSIQGMELALVHILGAHGSINFKEKWFEGVVQLPLSLEIVSIDGFIQFLIRCPAGWRDLIEGAIYAQYPDAEMTQVEDYVNTVPDIYPNPTHNMWGVEWVLDSNTCNPLRTYTEFEDKMNQVMVDPLAGLLEAMSKIGKGEQIWLQIIATPLGVDWVKDCQKEVDKMTGQEKAPKKKGLAKLLGGVESIIGDISEEAFGGRIFPQAEEKKKEGDAFGAIWKMSPGDRENLELMQKKMRKLAYGVKMRYGYFGELAVFNKAKGVQPVIGAIKQFNALGRNGFKPNMKYTATKAAYFNVKRRVAYKQKLLVSGLKKRDRSIGMKQMTLNVEELATLYHFPSMLVKAPMLKKTELVKREGPSNLPFEELPAGEIFAPQMEESRRLPPMPTDTAEQIAGEEGVQRGEPVREDAQVIESASYTFDYDNDEFEKRFAVNKDEFARRQAAKDAAKDEHAAEILWTSFGPKRFEEKAAEPKSLPPVLQADEKTVEVIDSFTGQNIISQAKKKVKRYDEEKDVPNNLPFLE